MIRGEFDKIWINKTLNAHLTVKTFTKFKPYKISNQNIL